MKKRSFFAICVMAATLAVATVSCKKDDQSTRTTIGADTAKEAYSPPRVDDMNTYLESFKGKMRNPTRGGDVLLSLEEAAWHLSSLANYDFANANVRFTDIRFDTLYCQVAVTGGQVSMADLGAAYSRAATTIDAFYHSLDLDEKHFRFIGADIDESGEVTLRVTTTYTLLDHVWYFPDPQYADSICNLYFDPNTYYAANGNGLNYLQQLVSMMVCTPQYPDHGRVFYTISREKDFYFMDYIDPYGSPNFMNSHIYCSLSYYNTAISADDMCYYLDSYLWLVTEYCAIDEAILEFEIKFGDTYQQPKEPCAGNHRLFATYGLPTINGNDFNY